MRRLLLPLLSLLLATSLLTAAESVVEPVLRRRVAPDYPAELKRRWPANLSEGTVTVEFIVDTRGNVAATHVERARFQDLIPPALAAIQKWKFKPARADGKAVPARVRAELQFSISGKPVAADKELPPTFVAIGDQLATSDAGPEPGALYPTAEALPHLEKIQPHLPADLRPGDPAGKTLVEPCPILMPLPKINRDVLAQAGGWAKYKVAAIVRPDGSLGNPFILSSTAPETDRAMTAAMGRWTYFAGTVNGKAASFLVVTDYEVGEIVTVEFGKDTPAAK